MSGECLSGLRAAERQAVFRYENLADLPKYLRKSRNRVVSTAEKIQVTGGSVWLIAPELKEHGAFQDEHVPVFGLTNAVQQPFQSVAGKHKLEILLARSRQIQQSLLCGCGKARAMITSMPR